jgi:hypothetical protein
LLTVFAAVVLAANANAAVVSLSMMKDTAGPGTWELRARSTPGDNGGIASFSIPLVDIATLTNEAPFYALNATNFRPGGFSELRVPATDNNPDEKTVFASQQLIPNPTPNIEYGFGQTAGSWFPTEYVAAAPWKRPSWGENLLLASGTYAPGADPRVDFFATSLSVLVFDNATGNEVIAADVSGPSSSPLLILNDVEIDTGDPIVRHTLHPVSGEPPFTWSLAPLSGLPAVPATISQNGEFEWHTIGSQRTGTYSWTVTVTNAVSSDTAVLTVNIIPEPASSLLGILALVGLAAFLRRAG